MPRTRVLAALSGGVDSSVAALLAQRAGHEVVGVFLRNGVSAAPAGSRRAHQGCCSVEDAADAARVADRLGIPFHALDMADEFGAIVDHFVAEYAAGRTPNPCAVCNRDVKFGALARFADALGAELLVTGHYACVRRGADGVELWRGVDRRKDQSYVLFPVAPEVLARTWLPLGGMEKAETRRLAEEAGFAVHDKPDSVEICFVPSGDYRDLLAQRGGLGKPGRFVDRDGRVLGEHDGHMGFTRGQRRGLGFAAGRPYYVLDVDPESGDVLVGPREETTCRRAVVEEFHGFPTGLAAGEVWSDVVVQYRSSFGETPAEVTGLGGGAVEVRFLAPAESVAPGQGLAVYRGDRLLGGGWIRVAEPVGRMAV